VHRCFAVGEKIADFAADADFLRKQIPFWIYARKNFFVKFYFLIKISFNL